MKIVFVDNQHDQASRALRDQVLSQLTQAGRTAAYQALLEKYKSEKEHGNSAAPLPALDSSLDAEIHIIDIEQAKTFLPISGPCFFLSFDDPGFTLDVDTLKKIFTDGKATMKAKRV